MIIQSKLTTQFARHNFRLVLIPLEWKNLRGCLCSALHAEYIVLCDRIKNMDFARFLLTFSFIYICLALLYCSTLADKEEGTEKQEVSIKYTIV
jgi:hypothetical protein